MWHRFRLKRKIQQTKPFLKYEITALKKKKTVLDILDTVSAEFNFNYLTAGFLKFILRSRA